MTTHARAVHDLDVGPPPDNCQGTLTFVTREARNGNIWNVYRCDGCGRRVFAERLYSLASGHGERFTAD
jgi:hypothetical protein